MRRLEADAPAIQTSLRLPASLVKALERRAKRDGVTRSELIRSLIAAGLDGWTSTESELARIADDVAALHGKLDRALKGKRRRSR